MSCVPKLERYPNWYELRLWDSYEKVAPEPIKKAFAEICEAFGYFRQFDVGYERRKEILKALDKLWEPTATEEELDKLHYDAATYWYMHDEMQRRAEAEEEERKRKEEEERSRRWYERIMKEKEERWAQERAEAEKKKGRKK